MSAALRSSDGQCNVQGRNRSRALLTASPLMDLVELAEGFCLYCNLPGVAPGEVHLTIDGETLYVRSEARLTPFKGKIHALEFSDILYEGKIRIPLVDVARVEATLANGLLRVFMPFKPKSWPVTIQVTGG